MKVRIDEELKELIPQFLLNRERDFLYLRDFLFQKRYEEAKEVTHSLKGVLGSYGFDEASLMAGKIDDQLREGRYHGLMEMAISVEEDFKNTEIEYIKEEQL
jgi:HPt (histidine-containing phosphotransfer) domain-containing protein